MGRNRATTPTEATFSAFLHSNEDSIKEAERSLGIKLESRDAYNAQQTLLAISLLFHTAHTELHSVISTDFITQKDRLQHTMFHPRFERAHTTAWNITNAREYPTETGYIAKNEKVVQEILVQQLGFTTENLSDLETIGVYATNEIVLQEARQQMGSIKLLSSRSYHHLFLNTVGLRPSCTTTITLMEATLREQQESLVQPKQEAQQAFDRIRMAHPELLINHPAARPTGYGMC